MSNYFTRMQYQAAIRAYHEVEERDLLLRYDAGEKEYGALDLDKKDWIKERLKETLDELAYKLFEIERLRRNATKATAALARGERNQ